LAAYAARRGGELVLVGLLVTPDGSRSIRDEVRADLGSGAASIVRAEELGARLGTSFFERGAEEIIELATAGAQ
ncbi:MAG: hypothetical protein ABR587_07600, partial [Candidatus Binatia bacterium]